MCDITFLTPSYSMGQSIQLLWFQKRNCYKPSVSGVCCCLDLGHFMEFYQTVYNLKVNERKILIMGSSEVFIELQESKMPCSSVINESLRSSVGALHLLKLPCKTNRSLWKNDFPISIFCDDVLLFNAISKGIVWIAQGSWSNFHKLFTSLYNNQYFNLEQRWVKVLVQVS